MYFPTYFPTFMIIITLGPLLILALIKSIDISYDHSKIKKINKTHRIVIKENVSINSLDGKLKKPISTSYQVKINNLWVNHNMNGPAVINYDKTTEKIISEQYYINGELCENELQYMIAIGNYNQLINNNF